MGRGGFQVLLSARRKIQTTAQARTASRIWGRFLRTASGFPLEYQATPFTNLNLKALVNYQSDPLVLHDFFEGDYTQTRSQTHSSRSTSIGTTGALTPKPRRASMILRPGRTSADVKLTGFRQQIFDTPLYYESESSAGYYRRFFAATNNNLFSATNSPPAYSAARADTFHQLLLPWTFFNWLNVTPHVGGRFTWYSQESGPGGTNDETDRAVFNTGVGTSFKVSRLWAGATNSLLDIDGLRQHP